MPSPPDLSPLCVAYNPENSIADTCPLPPWPKKSTVHTQVSQNLHRMDCNLLTTWSAQSAKDTKDPPRAGFNFEHDF